MLTPKLSPGSVFVCSPKAIRVTTWVTTKKRLGDNLGDNFAFGILVVKRYVGPQKVTKVTTLGPP